MRPHFHQFSMQQMHTGLNKWKKRLQNATTTEAISDIEKSLTDVLVLCENNKVLSCVQACLSDYRQQIKNAYFNGNLKNKLTELQLALDKIPFEQRPTLYWAALKECGFLKALATPQLFGPIVTLDLDISSDELKQAPASYRNFVAAVQAQQVSSKIGFKAEFQEILNKGRGDSEPTGTPGLDK